MTTPCHNAKNWIYVLEYWGWLCGPPEFLALAYFQVSLFSLPYCYSIMHLWTLRFRGKVPSSTYSGNLVVVFTVPSSSSSVPALTHVTHCHPAGCIRRSHGVHPSLVFSLTVVSESWPFDHIFKHSVTQLNLRLSQKAERDQMWSPRLAQAVMSLLPWLGSLSLDMTNLTELNWNNQPLSVWGLCSSQRSAFFYQNKWN